MMSVTSKSFDPSDHSSSVPVALYIQTSTGFNAFKKLSMYRNNSMQTKLAGLNVVLWAEKANSDVIVMMQSFNNNPMGLFHILCTLCTFPGPYKSYPADVSFLTALNALKQ